MVLCCCCLFWQGSDGFMLFRYDLISFYKMDLNEEGPRRRDQLGCYCAGQGRRLEIKQQHYWETEEKTK